MKHQVRVTVIDKKLYPDLQQQYCANPDSDAFKVGMELKKAFDRDAEQGI